MGFLIKIFSILTQKQLQRMIGLLFSMLIGGVLESLGIGAILPLISIMGQPDYLGRHSEIALWVARFGVNTHEKFIVFCAIGLIGMYLFKNLYLAWQTRLQIRFVMENQVWYTRQLFAEYLAKPYYYYLEHNTAEASHNIKSPTTVIFSGILMSTLFLLTEIVTGIAILGMLIIADPLVAIIVTGIFGGIVYSLFKGFREKISRQGSIRNEYQILEDKWINQGLQSIKDTKVLRRERFFCDAYSNVSEYASNANCKYMFIAQIPRLLIETAVVTGLLLLIVGMVWMGNKPEEIIPLFGVLAMAAFRLMPGANRIVGYLNSIKYHMPLFLQVYEDLLAVKQRMERDGGAREFFPPEPLRLPFMRELRIEHLGFHYPNSNQETLLEVSFSIPKGSFVGIVGPSGSGKTTFVDVLLGLLPPDRGDITADGVSIFGNVRAWQVNLAYVPQNIYLIDGSIRENIAFGRTDNEIDDEKIVQVLQMAELFDFISGLPEGIHTFVGERGVRLSGGQRQRIGIARALYCQPEVLVLDEATSALDQETEKSITDTLLNLKGHITIIAIAHRVSTLEACDFKVRFQDGWAHIVQD